MEPKEVRKYAGLAMGFMVTLILTAQLTLEAMGPAAAEYNMPIGTCHATKSIGGNYRLSICGRGESAIVDIREFINMSRGLKPTIKGLNLNLHQWANVAASHEWIQANI
jgi:hypothetical protein